MDNEVVLELKESIERLKNTMEGIDGGIGVHLVGQTTTSLIADSIREGLETFYSESSKKREEEARNKKGNKTLDNVHEELIKSNQISSELKPLLQDLIIGYKKNSSDIKNKLEEINKRQEQENKNIEKKNSSLSGIGDDSSFLGGMFGTFNKIYRYISFFYDIAKGVGSKFIELSKANIDLYQKLYTSGVNLQKGFDESVYQLSSQAGLQVEKFVDVLSKNSVEVNRLAQMTVEGGESIISKGISRIMKTGLATEEEALGIIESYNETLNKFTDYRELSESKYLDGLEKVTKATISLKNATGESVELINQKNKIEEENILHNSLKSDNDPLYRTLKSLKLTNKEIEYVLTGAVSPEVVTQTSLNANDREILSNLRGIVNTYGNTAKAYENIEQYLKQSHFSVPDLSAGEQQLLAYDASNTLSKIYDTRLTQAVNAYGKEKPNDNANNDSAKFSKMVDLQVELNRIYNETASITRLSFNDATKYYDYAEKKLSSINDWLTKFLSDEDVKNISSSLVLLIQMMQPIAHGVLVMAGSGLGFGLIKKVFSNGKTPSINPSLASTGGFGSKIAQGAGFLGKLAASAMSLLQTKEVLSDFYSKGVYQSVEDTKKNWEVLDYLNPSKLAAVSGAWVGEQVGDIMSYITTGISPFERKKLVSENSSNKEIKDSINKIDNNISQNPIKNNDNITNLINELQDNKNGYKESLDNIEKTINEILNKDNGENFWTKESVQEILLSLKKLVYNTDKSPTMLVNTNI